MTKGTKSAEAYEALRAAEQEHRAEIDAHTQHVWAAEWDAYRESACEVSRREAWAKVQKAAEAYNEILYLQQDLKTAIEAYRALLRR